MHQVIPQTQAICCKRYFERSNPFRLRNQGSSRRYWYRRVRWNFLKLGLREGEGEVTPKYVGEFLSKMVMDKLRRDAMENFFSDEELPAFKSLFFYVSGDAPDDLGMKLADVTLPYLWNIKMNNFLTFLLRPKMVHFAKVVLSHYLINFVIKPWALDMSKRAEMWTILGETRASLLNSSPRAIEDINGPGTNKAAKNELVQGLKDLVFSKLPDPRKKLEKEGPFEMVRSRLNLPKNAPITKEMTSLFLVSLFEDQITYDTAAALFKKIKFPYLGRTLTDPVEELIEQRISQLITPLVIDKFDLLSPEVITKFTTLHVVKPWTVDPKKRAELLELLEISHGFLNPLDVSLLV